MNRIYLLILMFVVGTLSEGVSQTCDSTQLDIRQVRASDTDPDIPWELAQHYVFYNSTCTPKNKLLIYMVGTYGNPNINQLFPSLAANNGFHVISLKYPNGKFAYQVCGSDADIDCYKNFRHESLYGDDVSSGITVDTANSILNRATKLLAYLDQQYPTENWGQYLTGTDINWSKVTASGHSQGAGHAAYMGHEFGLERVLMFSGPLEYSTYFNDVADWFSHTRPTPDSAYYAFGNINDEVASFANLLLGWSAMGLSNYGDSLDISGYSCSYEDNRILYTSQLFSGSATSNHGSTVADDHTPVDGNGYPEFTPVWKYMLGICDNSVPTAISSLNKQSSIEVYPNPSTGTITLTYQLKDGETAQFELWDINGKKVYSTSLLPHTTFRVLQYDESIPAGVYHYRVTVNEVPVTTEKLVISE